MVGRGGPARSEAESLEAARNDAIELLTQQMLVELSSSHALYELVRAARNEGERDARSVRARVAERYLDDVGAIASPERVDAVVRQRASGTEAYVRYKLSRAAFGRAIDNYRASSAFRGMTVGAYFPQLEWIAPSDGRVVVVGVRRGSPAAAVGIRLGNVVLAVNGRPVYSAKDFGVISTEEWSKTPYRGLLEIQLDADGALTEVKLRKPPPPKPKPPKDD